MIDLHYWPTPNGQKITIALEEMGLPYRVHRVDITKGQQFEPAFLAISPNNKMPAIVDHAPESGGEPVSVFESGAILLYLAHKTRMLMPDDPRQRIAAHEWLFWQVGGLGPMLGQLGHFKVFAKDKIPYAIERYENETKRLYDVMNKRLALHSYLAGEHYSVADVASFPWARGHERLGVDVTPYPHVRRWLHAIAERPAVQRALAIE